MLALALPALWGQQTQPPKEEEPPEEDEALKPKEYTLNPLQAEKEISAGNFYLKKGNLRAAARRYKEATMWDPGSPTAYQKLADASEKIHDYAGARAAYTKAIELAGSPKDADALKKKLDKLPKK